MKLALLAGMILCVAASILAQESNSSITQLIENTSEIYGANDKLVSGQVYYPLHPGAEEKPYSPYYPYQDYHPGTLYMNGDEFRDEKIKYNIEIQKLVLNKELSNGVVVEILLINNRIDSFSLNNRMFINSRLLSDSLSGEEFFELVHRGKRTYLAKHRILFSNKYDQRNPYGKYHKPGLKYYLSDNNRLIPIKNKRQFVNLFAPSQKEIKKYIRKNNIKFRKIKPRKLRNLIIASEQIN